MKVIRLSTFLDYGGIETKMANLSVSDFKEIEWVFMAIGKGGDAEKKILNNNKQVICLNNAHKIPSVSALYTLYKIFKKLKPNVVHCSGAEANFHGVIAAKMAKIKIIISEEIGIANQSYKARVIFKFIYKLSDYVIGESKKVVDNLRIKYAIPENKLVVVHNFIDVNQKIEEHKIRTTSAVINIISVCRLEPIKNIFAVLNVIKKLKLNGHLVEYTIVGDGSLLDNLRNRAIALDLIDEVHFAGYQNNLKPFYENADLFVLNSFSEGFSNSLLEAMLMKVPSITTNVGAAQEFIKNGENGWIIERDNESSLYQSIVAFINLPESAQLAVGETAHTTVRDNFSLESHLNKLNKIYTYER